MRTHSGTRLSAVLRSCSVTSSEFWRMRCVSWNTTTNYHMYTIVQMHLSRSLVTRHVYNSAAALGQKPSHSTWPLLLQCIKPQRLWLSLLVNAWSVHARTCQLPNMGQLSHQPINWDKHTAHWCCVFTAAWTNLRCADFLAASCWLCEAEPDTRGLCALICSLPQ